MPCFPEELGLHCACSCVFFPPPPTSLVHVPFPSFPVSEENCASTLSPRQILHLDLQFYFFLLLLGFCLRFGLMYSVISCYPTGIFSLPERNIYGSSYHANKTNAVATKKDIHSAYYPLLSKWSACVHALGCFQLCPALCISGL